MPVVLSQLFSPTDRIYEDAEYALYHYPRVYFSRVRRYEPFVYYRPLGRSRRRLDSMSYFGHGVIGEWYEDWRDPRFRFANLVKAAQFPRPVGLRDARGLFYETESDAGPQFQSAVRELSATAYHRILSAAGVTQQDLDTMPSTESLALSPYPLPLVAAPTDALRRIDEIPPGAGYVPRAENSVVNVYESAALQERARRDHQETLRIVQRAILRAGGTTWYNNNIDLFAAVAGERFLIEAKSVGTPTAIIDRTRYGIGQLADYAYRYESQTGNAQRVLAFARVPERENAWISGVLENERIAFIAAYGDRVVPLNERAADLPFAGDSS